MDKNMKKVRQILNIIEKYDTKDRNFFAPYIKNIARNAIITNEPLTFICFTCSNIRSEYLFDTKNPELYISLDPKGNNLEPDLDKLEKLYSELSKYIEIRLIILIGNTDPFYIYTQETQALPKMTEEEFLNRFEKRWNIYKKNLEAYLKKQKPNLIIKVISWYELEKDQDWDFKKQFTKTRKNISKYFSNEDLKWELEKFKKAFGQGTYFSNMKSPTIDVLKAWVERKFAEYAVQGLWIKQIFPDAILLQNEKPSDLRTRMYQPLIQEVLNCELPVFYPFGIDNVGFQ